MLGLLYTVPGLRQNRAQHLVRLSRERGVAATVDLINVFNAASVFCVHGVSSSVTHPEMHGCFVVFRFRAVFTVRFVGGEIPLLVLLCWSLGRFPLSLFANIIVPF